MVTKVDIDKIFAELMDMVPDGPEARWHYIKDDLPYLNGEYLVSIADESGPEVYCYTITASFINIPGHPLWVKDDSPITGVYAWAELPDEADYIGG